MKKVFYIMFLLLSFALAGCGAQESKKDNIESESQPIVQTSDSQTDKDLTTPFDETEYLHGVASEMISGLQDLAKDIEYLRLLASSEELVKVFVFWKDLSIDTKEPVQKLLLSEATIDDYFLNAGEISLTNSNLAESSKKILYNKIRDNISATINSQCSAKVMAASSVVTYSRTYVPKGTVNNQVWFVPASNGIYFSISFTETGDGAITATATFVETANGIKEILETVYGPYPLQLTEFEWEAD